MTDTTVWVGAPLSETSLPAKGKLVVVEADQERADWLRERLQGRQNTMVCTDVLSAETGALISWCRFNDTRMNGPLTVMHWKKRYPNLRQEGVEQRRSRRLEDVLNNCTFVEKVKDLITLHIHQGDPLTTLEGLGPWLRQVEAVQGAEHLMLRGTPAEDWLANRGFRKEEDTLTGWRWDPLTTLQLILQEQDAQIDTLESQLVQATAELEKSQTKNEALSRAYELLKTEQEALETSCTAHQHKAEQQEEQLAKITSELEKIIALIEQIEAQ